MYERGLQLIPAQSPMREAFDALELSKCGVDPPSFGRRARQLPALAAGSTFYVDFTNGDDGKAGSADAPFKTIAKGVSAARAATTKPATIVLRAGVHFLADTINLTPEDSGLTITADPSAKAKDLRVQGLAASRVMGWPVLTAFPLHGG